MNIWTIKPQHFSTHRLFQLIAALSPSTDRKYKRLKMFYKLRMDILKPLDGEKLIKSPKISDRILNNHRS